MTKSLRVLVAGTGFAGKGHTRVFRTAGAEVVGIVGRTNHVVRKVTEKLTIRLGAALALRRVGMGRATDPDGNCRERSRRFGRY